MLLFLGAKSILLLNGLIHCFGVQVLIGSIIKIASSEADLHNCTK